jgi:hypothetical protein
MKEREKKTALTIIYPKKPNTRCNEWKRMS